jgi:hypothetical protein
MQTAPSIQEIKDWLIKNNPLGWFDQDFDVADIDPKDYSGHFNYLVTPAKSKNASDVVLRFKGPEWGEPTQGVIDEFRILHALGPYNIAPKVFFLTERDFFGEAMLFEEYLNGEIINRLPEQEFVAQLPDVARYIGRINSVPTNNPEFPFREHLLSYAPHKEEWRHRVEIAKGHEPSRAMAEKIEHILPRAEAMLDQFEPVLARVLQQVPPAFVFISSHVGHCLKHANDLRFFNWEQVSYGDPSYTLAVFLASIRTRPDFEIIKRTMIDAYLKSKPTPEFEILIEQRLDEREISNLTWILWVHADRQDKRPIAEATSIMQRFARVTKMFE